MTSALVIGKSGRLGPIWIQALENAGCEVNGTDADVRGASWCVIRASWCVSEPFDVVVLNAGIDHRPGSDVDPTELIDVNLLGAYHVLESSLVKPGGSVILVASLYALVAGKHKHPLYGATKAALCNLVKSYAVQHAPTRYNAIALGGVQGDQSPEFIAEYAAKVPLGRMAQPEDITGPLLFLASDASRYVTGTTLVVDGGYTCL